MREIVTFFDFLLVTSAVLGTGLGFMFCLVFGPSKMTEKTCCISASAVELGFRVCFGPLLGLKGKLLQRFLGVGEILGGAIIFIGVWLDVIPSVPFPLKDFMRGMIIVTAVGLLGELGVATALRHRLAEIDEEDDSDDDDIADGNIIAGIGTKCDKVIPKACIPFFYAVLITVFLLIRIIGFTPESTFTVTLIFLMSISLLILAGSLVFHVHEKGRHRRELAIGLEDLHREQIQKGGFFI